ncbi:hypothetical protein GCM10009811_06180 [Nostocoides veronense]|uniref:4Fe-4S Wbl-type domain-containing protein n=1 Tax=Nostocoides veronense TaxID=330836 RepID=A0ABP4XI29_9MICO
MVTASRNFPTRRDIGKVAGNRHLPSPDALTCGNTKASDPPAAAHGRLVDAINGLLDADRRTPCLDPDRRDDWTAEHPDDRARAARACRPCTLIELCADAGDEIAQQHGRRGTWGVWGGQDRSPQPAKAATP